VSILGVGWTATGEGGDGQGGPTGSTRDAWRGRSPCLGRVLSLLLYLEAWFCTYIYTHICICTYMYVYILHRWSPTDIMTPQQVLPRHLDIRLLQPSTAALEYCVPYVYQMGPSPCPCPSPEVQLAFEEVQITANAWANSNYRVQLLSDKVDALGLFAQQACELWRQRLCGAVGPGPPRGTSAFAFNQSPLGGERTKLKQQQRPPPSMAKDKAASQEGQALDAGVSPNQRPVPASPARPQGRVSPEAEPRPRSTSGTWRGSSIRHDLNLKQ
jgi:hypothetical protein